jgi:hypothetical protein
MQSSEDDTSVWQFLVCQKPEDPVVGGILELYIIVFKLIHCIILSECH